MQVASAFAEGLQTFSGVPLDLVITFLLFLLAAGAFLVERVLGRRRLSYRILHDSPLMVSAPALRAGSVTLSRHGTEIHDLSMVLLRVVNTGHVDIVPGDIDSALTFSFPGREIVEVEVPAANPEALRTMLLDQFELSKFVGRSKLAVPRVALNRRDRFTLLVLLTGGGAETAVSGFLSGGRIEQGTSTRRLSQRMPTVLAMLLVAALVYSLFVPRGSAPAYCATGNLEILASSDAQTGTFQKIVDNYGMVCEDANIQVVASGSPVRGLRSLTQNLSSAADVIAVSIQTPDPDLTTSLQSRPVYAAVYAVVVNESTGISNMTTDQLRRIYSGKLTNWDQLGGPDLPIRIVGRDLGSGTRRAFEERVLGRSEPPVNSDDCTRARLLELVVSNLRCEVESTTDALQRINNIPGAIGYAEVEAAREARVWTNVVIVKLDSNSPDPVNVSSGSYPFWAVVRAYTIGEPTGLPAVFLDYLRTDRIRSMLSGAGYIPCDGGGSPC